MLGNILCLYLCACLSVTLSVGPADLGCHGDRCRPPPPDPGNRLGQLISEHFLPYMQDVKLVLYIQSHT